MIISLTFAFIFGLIIGSFFNVLIWRLPRGESIVSPPSHCPVCNFKLPAYHNIPLISYLFLRGKCAHCHTAISPLYPLIELATSLAAVLCWNTLAPHYGIQWWMYIAPIVKTLTLLLMIPIMVIDLRHLIIPDKLTLTGLLIGCVISFIPGDTTPLQSLLGIAAGGGSLWLIGWIGTLLFKKGDAMGGGDIKLMAFAGAVWGPKIVLLGIMFGSISGAIAGIALIIFHKLRSDRRIPFGPFLGAGLWIAVFAGNFLYDGYLKWIDSLLLR